jgi:hypothetical protein
MADAREEFCMRITALREAILVPSIQPDPSKCVVQNYPARMLRNGLCIVGFSCLEDFIRRRFAEIATSVCSRAIPFDHLPEPLQQRATLGAIKSIAFQAKLLRKRKEDDLAFIQHHAESIASTATSAYSVSSVAFCGDQSNLSADNVVEFAKCFDIQDFWRQIASLAPRVGFGGAADYRQSFIDAMLKRHQAAHRPNADTSISFLHIFLDEAMAISLAIDAIATFRSRELATEAHISSKLPGDSVCDRIRFRFLRARPDRKFAEHTEKVNRAYRVSTDFNSLRIEAANRARGNGETFVEMNARNQPVIWIP